VFCRYLLKIIIFWPTYYIYYFIRRRAKAVKVKPGTILEYKPEKSPKLTSRHLMGESI